MSTNVVARFSQSVFGPSYIKSTKKFATTLEIATAAQRSALPTPTFGTVASDLDQFIRQPFKKIDQTTDWLTSPLVNHQRLRKAAKTYLHVAAGCAVASTPLLPLLEGPLLFSAGTFSRIVLGSEVPLRGFKGLVAGAVGGAFIGAVIIAPVSVALNALGGQYR